jgi:hypothetical protein
MGEKRKISNATKGIVVFAVFVALFTLFRHPIGNLNAKLLVATGDLPPAALTKKLETPEGTPPVASNAPEHGKRKKKNRLVVIDSRAAQLKYIDDNPVTSPLPETKTPTVAFYKTISTLESSPFPPLRGCDGTICGDNGIVVRAATDGKTIRFDCLLTNNASPDARVELFLMKNRCGKTYRRYILPLSGQPKAALLKKLPSPRRAEPIANSESKATLSTAKTQQGILARFDVPISDLEMDHIAQGETIFAQIAYTRGTSANETPDTLQLFPSHIYGDNRFGANNEDRRAFRPLRIAPLNHQQPKENGDSQ